MMMIVAINVLINYIIAYFKDINYNMSIVKTIYIMIMMIMIMIRIAITIAIVIMNDF